MAELGERVKKGLKVAAGTALLTVAGAGVLRVADNNAQTQDEARQRSSYTQEQINAQGFVVNMPEYTEEYVNFQKSILEEYLKPENKLTISRYTIDVPSGQQLRVRSNTNLDSVNQTHFLGIFPEGFRGQVYSFRIQGEKDPRDGSAYSTDWIVVFLPPKVEGEKPYLGFISAGMLTEQSLESDHQPIEVIVGDLDQNGFPTAINPDGSRVTIGQISPIPPVGTT
ncbi:MAG: hypothetical protein ABH812_02985 [bacterium]